MTSLEMSSKILCILKKIKEISWNVYTFILSWFTFDKPCDVYIGIDRSKVSEEKLYELLKLLKEMDFQTGFVANYSGEKDEHKRDFFVLKSKQQSVNEIYVGRILNRRSRRGFRFFFSGIRCGTRSVFDPEDDNIFDRE